MPGARPSRPARSSGKREVRRTQGSTVFALQRIGNYLFVSHIAGNPDASAIQLRAGVSCAIGAVPIDFQRCAVVEFPRRRPPAYGNAAKPFIVKARHREFPAGRWNIMPVIVPDKFAGWFQVDWPNFKHRMRPLASENRICSLHFLPQRAIFVLKEHIVVD